MKKNSKIKEFRIESETYDKIIKLLEEINKKEEMSLASFCRHALRHFTSKIVSEGLVIQFLPQDK